MHFVDLFALFDSDSSTQKVLVIHIHPIKLCIVGLADWIDLEVREVNGTCIERIILCLHRLLNDSSPTLPLFLLTMLLSSLSLSILINKARIDEWKTINILTLHG